MKAITPENTPENTPEKFHKLYGEKKVRINYQSKDFLDYTIMTVITAAVIGLTYGADHWMTLIGIALCVFMVATFPLRHGVKLTMPLIVRRPQDMLYILIHKIQNIKLPYFLALGLLLLENYLIDLTPDWPHKVGLMHQIALYAFYLHFLFIAGYRTISLVVHLNRKNLVREILMQSIWRSSLEKQPSVALEIMHAYFTGMLTHIVYIVPWYLVISYFNFSLIFLPITCIAAIIIQKKFAKVINDWFYRDHWLGHNSEMEFVYLHGPHHDAIPSGLIAVAGNGYLEGFFRGIMAFPVPFYNPVMAAVFYTIDVKIDIDSHQFIPGMYPKVPREFYEVTQHSIHHFGRVEPYGFAINLDVPDISEETKNLFNILPDELKYSIRLDQKLTNYEWENQRHKWFLELVDKYQDVRISAVKSRETEVS